MNRAEYERYLTCFHARDYDGVLSYYADDLEVAFAGYSFRSKDEVRDFYAFFHTYVDEHIEVDRYVADEQTIAMEARVRVTGLKDLTPEVLAEHGYPQLEPLQRGQTVEIPQFIHYHLVGGKLAKALCAVVAEPRLIEAGS